MTTIETLRTPGPHAATATMALLALRDEVGTADARRELTHGVGADEVWSSRFPGRASDG